MIRMYIEYGQLLIVDATYRSNHYNMKLLLFTVRTGNGKFSIVGLALLQHETAEDLRWSFIELLKAASTVDEPSNTAENVTESPSINQASQTVLTVLTDGAQAYPSIVQELFPHAAHQLCYWHQKKRMDEFCVDHLDKSVRAAAQDAIVAVLREDDPIKAESLWMSLKKDYFDSGLAELTQPVADCETAAQAAERAKLNKTRSNARKLLQTWYDMRHKYWCCYTKLLRNYGSISSQAGESMNHAVKRQNKVSLIQLVQMTGRVITNHVFEQMKAWNEAGRIVINADPGINSLSSVLRSSLTVYSCDLLLGQLKVAQEYALVPSTRIVDLEAVTCTCGFTRQHGLICRHLMIQFLIQRYQKSPNAGQLTTKSLFTDELKSEVAQFCIEHTDSRWTHAAALRVIGENVSQHSQQTDHHSLDTHHHTIAARPATHIPNTNFMLQHEIDVMLERMKQFGMKDINAARLLLVEGNACLDSLETRYADHLHFPAITITNTPQLIESASVARPVNPVDPINHKRDQTDARLSTQNEAKSKRQRKVAHK